MVSLEMRTKQCKTFSIYRWQCFAFLVVKIEMPVTWDGERIGRRKKKSAWGTMGRGKRESEASGPLPPFFPSHRPPRAFVFSIIAAIGSLCGRRELKPLVQYHVRYTQLHFLALFQFKALRLNTKYFILSAFRFFIPILKFSNFLKAICLCLTIIRF